MYGSSRRKVSEQRKAVPKPKPKRIVKTTKSKVEANKRVVDEEGRKATNKMYGFKFDVEDISSSSIIPRTITGAKKDEMKRKFREWREKNDGKRMTLPQAESSFKRFLGPPKRAPPPRPAPRRNGNGNGNGGRK